MTKRSKQQLQYYNVTINGMIHQLPATSRKAAMKEAEKLEKYLSKKVKVKGEGVKQ